MKARITTVLSLTGVLVAGSAAALVNTQVLQSSTTKSTASAEVSINNRPESVSTVSTAPSVSVSVPNKLAGIAGVAVTLASTPVSTQQQYAVGESGTVVLDTANGVLTIVGIYPNAGWGVLEHKNSDSLSIEIKFQSATTLVEFKANVLMGVVAFDTESYLLPQSTTGNTTGNSTAGTSGSSTKNTTGSSVDDHDDDDDSGHHGGGGDDD
ncbi:MAG: hypothetical protein HY828_04515 [Actinobacteria bacterium]|nr:hypothetical protein [Actinomycetota bacterium]